MTAPPTHLQRRPDRKSEHGQSTLFTGLVGVRQQVGNYPGVTVEKKTGRMDFAGRRSS